MTDAAPQLLRYRPWRGTLRGPWSGTLAIARSSVKLLFRRPTFWWLYGLSVMIFLFFFYGQYLQVWLEQKVQEESIRVGGLFPRNVRPDVILKGLRNALMLNGTGHTYANFVWFEGYIVIVMLAFTGSLLVGNDFQHNSMPYYLSKPIGRRHYLAGKMLAVAAVTGLVIVVPALILYIEYGIIDSYNYWLETPRLLAGIFGYGLLVTACLSSLLLALSIRLKRTVPMVMAWVSAFVLGKVLAKWLADGLKLSPRWRLLDLWNDLFLSGQWMLGTDHDDLRPKSQMQPEYVEAFAVAVTVTILGWFVAVRRVRAVEVVA